MEFDGKLFLFAAADKVIKGWRLPSAQQSTPQSIEPLESEFKASKRIGALVAINGVLIYGDKFGEVYQLTLNATNGSFGEPTFVLSHVSIITDMVLP